MLKKTMMIASFSLLQAAALYDAPNEDGTKISEIDPQHEYLITTQDWVKVVDKSTQQEGWAKLSELKAALSTNSQWAYTWQGGKQGSTQSMYYRPLTEKDIRTHVKEAHRQHKRIMSQFRSFWKDLDDITESFDELINTEAETS